MVALRAKYGYRAREGQKNHDYERDLIARALINNYEENPVLHKLLRNTGFSP